MIHNASELANLLDIDPVRIVTDPDCLDEFSWDALSLGRIHPHRQPPVASPICVVSPLSTDEVRRIVLFACRERIPLLPFGGGSGLMGGALSVRPGIVVDMHAMNQMGEVDPEAQSACVQAGIVLEVLERKLNEQGFILGHDPWTVPIATVGGAISTNGMGYRGGVYGSMGEQVLGLEAVLPDGEIVRTRAIQKSSTGIHLNGLLIGGEGCFGIITEATIRIFPCPETRALDAFVFTSFDEGYRAVQRLFMCRLKPAVMDLGDHHESYPNRAVLYLGFEGIGEVVRSEKSLARSICEESGAGRLPEEEAQRFWRDRHIIARRFMQNRRQRRDRGKGGVYHDWVHAALPSSRVLPFRADALRIAERRGVEVQESGLWVQPELFSMRLSIDDQGDARLALQDTVEELVQQVHKMGGSMEYAHGVGVKLAAFMKAEHGYGFEVMRQIKAALDPHHIMNPGKMGL
ncbi:MAG TPA: FAD-binding oxidoreductase [Terriglobales bacterium]|nr:FAD-binding oxidoreductase [Terriglobales bacterium]